jgi:hypothetical protein
VKSTERTEESSKVGKAEASKESRGARLKVVDWRSGSSLSKALNSRRGNRGIARSEVSAFSRME